MKFFIPAATSDAQAEDVWKSVQVFALETTGWNIAENRIFRIRYFDRGIERLLEVGKVERETGEPIVAILESNAYLVCTPSRGVARGEPLMYGRNEVFGVELFD